MATAEALEFLNWLQKDANHARCLEQADQWKNWTSSEGFDPDAILDGLREISRDQDESSAFLSYLQHQESGNRTFRSWIESILKHQTQSTEEDLTGLSGGTQTKSSFALTKLQHYTHHLNAELLEVEATIRDNTTKSDSWNGRTTYTYSGKDVNGELTVYKDYYGWGANGYYNGKNGWYNSISGQANSNKQIQWVQINNKDYNHSKITREDASLLAKASSIEKHASGFADSIKSAWNKDLYQWTQNEILQSKRVESIKSLHGDQYTTAKAVLEQINHVDYKSLSERKKAEVFILDKQAENKLRSNQAEVEAKKEEINQKLLAREEHEESVLENIETLQKEYTSFKKDYSKAKQPTEDYFALFGRLHGNTSNLKTLHRVHYDNYGNQIKYSKSHWSNGNHDYAENYLKVRTNLAAKREEMFGRSEAHAVRAATATYQKAAKEGNPRKVCLAMATETYVQTLATEDVEFLLKKRDRYEAARDNWKSMTPKERRKYDSAIDPIINEELDHSGHGNDRRQADLVGDVLLSVGADIVQRQVDVAKKAYRDQQRKFSALRLELLVSRLTMEYSMAERYENWYAKHPTEQYHPVKIWFAHAWDDIWDTLTLPYRAVKAEIKAWKSGEGFWAGMKAGWKVEGRILHQDVHGINHMVKGFEKLVAPMFDWIPGVKKFVEIDNLVFRALESIPFHIARNVTSLGKQLYRVVTLKASWKGIWDGLGRDTRGIRHLIRHIDWLAHDVLTGHFKNIGQVLSRDFNTARKGVKIYMDRKEIEEALVIKHDELLARRKLHRHFHHLVKSPTRIIADDAVRNLKNDKAFVGFRQMFTATEEWKIYEHMLSLKPGIKALKNALKTEVNEINVGMHNQYKALTKKQQAKLILDYQHNELGVAIIKHEKTTLLGQKVEKQLKQVKKEIEFIPGIGHTSIKQIKGDIQETLTGFQAYLKSRQSGMQKKAQAWALDGGLLKWAQNVDKTFVKDAKEAEKFLQSPQGEVVKAKALESYFVYKNRQTYKKIINTKHEDLQKSTDEIKESLEDDSSFVDSVKAYRTARKEYKAYRREKAYLLRQWKKWGIRDGKIALTAYDITFGVEFSVNYDTTPPTVTCSNLKASESKQQNKYITSKHIGKRFFMRLMWTQILTNKDELTSINEVRVKTAQLIKQDVSGIYLLTREVEHSQLASDVQDRLELVEKMNREASSFFSSHIVFKDLLEVEDGGKIRSFKQSAELKLQSLANRVRQVRTGIRLIREYAPLARQYAPDRVNKALKREDDFVKLMNVQISEFDKSNFELFEAQKFSNLKLLKLQAALAYDFDDTVTVNKGSTKIEPSRYQMMKKNASTHNKNLTSDYKEDQQEEAAGDDLTIGQVLQSVEVAPSKTSPHTLKHQWSAINGSNSTISSGSGSANNSSSSKGATGSDTSGGSSTANGGSSSNLGKFWIKFPYHSSSTPTRKTTANVLLLWRNYELIKRLTNKKGKAAEAESDFEAMTSKEVPAAERRLNREAIRLDDDLDLFKHEVELDEKVAEDAVKAETKEIEADLQSITDHGKTNKGDDILPDGEKTESIVELDEFANGVIQTAQTDAVEGVTSTIDETEAQAAVDEETGEALVEFISL